MLLLYMPLLLKSLQPIKCFRYVSTVGNLFQRVVVLTRLLMVSGQCFLHRYDAASHSVLVTGRRTNEMKYTHCAGNK